MVVDGLQVTHYVPEGSVVISNGSVNNSADPYGGNAWFYQLLLHETGHAMNLKHPHDGWIMLDPEVDTNVHTVMTYHNVLSPRAGYSDYDVAALQWRYGTDGLGGTGAWTTGAAPHFSQTVDSNDSMVGGPGADYLFGNAGDDTLIGGAGNDELVGWSGADTMNGGDGNDSYLVSDADTLVDSGGIDTIYTSLGSWTLAAGFENLRFNTPLDSTTAAQGTGNAAANLITGNAGSNLLKGLGGNDTLWGLDGADTLIGGGGDDMLVAGFGGDVLTGNAGHDRFVLTQPLGNPDTITDFSGADEIHLDANIFFGLGAAGQFAASDARFYADAGAVNAHDADDRIIFNTSTGQLFWDSDGTGIGGNNNPAYLIATVQAGASVSAADIWVDQDEAPGAFVLGTSGADTLAGSDGNDRLDGLAGIDSMSGGVGNDTYVVTAGDAVSDSGGVDWIYSWEGSWHLGAGFENLALVAGSTAKGGVGNGLDNRMVGNQLANSLSGGGGDDDLLGGGGNDNLQGKTGNDTLQGGSGADAFTFANSGLANADVISDFGNGSDSVRLSHAAFDALGAAGRMSTDDARFYAAAGAAGGHDASDRIVYDSASGQLYYDADGSGPDSAQPVATLTGHPALTAGDVVVF
jgi:Ca2+-binding RTX toxin-like protein